MARSLCWIRRDIRLSDHVPLATATETGKAAVVFVFDRNILDQLEDRDDRRLTFIHQSLRELDSKLRAQGSRLIVRHGDPREEIPKVARELEATSVVTARDLEPYAIQRDGEMGVLLKQEGIQFQIVRDTLTLDPEELCTQAGMPFRAYSPYGRAWRAAFVAERDAADHQADLSRLVSADALPAGELEPLEAYGFVESELWTPAGEDAAQARLEQFSRKLKEYGEMRDIPAGDHTSALSVHLRFGTISTRACVRAALADGSEGADKWLAELIWREFYHQILFRWPEVVETTFQPQYRDLEYPGEPEHWAAWCKGLTGYPIIDAAMRCFNATGWMHNRLRMVVASFLTKDLLLDYKLGEAYFARYLLDFDLASNNGGWQWAASVGCDPQPYFRIFNPISQGTKFDPEGTFVREWVPELREVPSDYIHRPFEMSRMELMTYGVELGVNYPKPIVDHATQRDRAIALLAAKKQTG